MEVKKIQSALISVFDKTNLEEIAKKIHSQGVKIYSTGGTQTFIENLGIQVTAVENLTSYPSIFGGRVKTLHPKIFGGILFRRDSPDDVIEAEKFEIAEIDLVIVDLYPFEATLASGASDAEIIEKIDIGGVSLIRAAAKNFKDVAIVSSQKQYSFLLEILDQKNASTNMEDRRLLATQAFATTSHYDTAIFNYFNGLTHASNGLRISLEDGLPLRYGENPHQKSVFYGNLSDILEQYNGKELSYNNLVDINDAIALVEDFEETTYAIIKHTNACGIASGDSPKEAYLRALASDPVSAFGGVICTNRMVDIEVAEELNKLFFEVLIAPGYEERALQLLSEKKNRILLRKKTNLGSQAQYKTLLNGVILQDKDTKVETVEDLKTVSKKIPTQDEIKALLFANKVAKHTKSNTIVLATKDRMISSGVGQTSRVDALKQAIEKARSFGLSLEGAVMASDAFFPFPDCVEIAGKVGITAVIQPGGSIKDQESIDYCDQHNMVMVMTGFRHFKH